MEKHTVAFVLCSRPESSRLPEKVFQKAAGVPILRLISERSKGIKARRVLALPRAVASASRYDATYASLWEGEFFYGSDTSPLHRMAEFLEENPEVKWVIRATHDDPIIDAEEANKLVIEAEGADAGYAVTTSIIPGAGVEVMRRENILAAAAMYEDTEFVSYFVRGEEMPFPRSIRVGARFGVCSTDRLTIDYPADLDVLRAVLSAVGPYAATENIVAFLEHSPARVWNSLPDLTVYTCVKNGEATIGRAVQSVLPVLKSIRAEYILVDDGSTDATLANAMAAMDRDRSRVIVNTANLGLASSSNIAVNAARGRWVMRLDADDTIENPDGLVKMIGMAEEEDLQVVYPAYYEADGDEFASPQAHHHAGCALMDRAIINELRFRDGLRHWDSAELHRRLISRGVRTAYYPHPVWRYSKTPGQMSTPSPVREAVRKRLGL